MLKYIKHAINEFKQGWKEGYKRGYEQGLKGSVPKGLEKVAAQVPTIPTSDVSTPYKRAEVSSTQLRLYGVAVAALFYTLENGYVIVTDEVYNRLPEHVQIFLITHERGHLANNHCQGFATGAITTDRIDYILRGEVHPTEIEADQFAVNEIGLLTCIHALNTLIAMKDELKLEDVSVSELNKRINIMKANN